MITDGLLALVLPPLTWLRENIFMNISEILGRILQLNVLNIYNILIFLISFWLANKILGHSYKTLTGRWTYLFIITGILFYLLRFVGA